MRRKRVILWLAALLLVASFTAGQLRLSVSRYDCPVAGLPDDFEGYRIVQLSDLHGASFGKENRRLVDRVRRENPDIIVLTGDFIEDAGDLPVTGRLLPELTKIAPCYFVSGNHEVRHKKLDEYKEIVASCGVTVLDGTHTKMAISALSTEPDIYGFDDVTAYKDITEQIAHMEQTTQNYHFEESFNVLLVHRPEYIEQYAKLGFDLVLCGHAHGGQWRIPGVLNGIYAPGQGLFPKYDGGLYTKDDTNMVVSRGVGNSLFPFRVNNRPEIVLVELRGEEND